MSVINLCLPASPDYLQGYPEVSCTWFCTAYTDPRSQPLECFALLVWSTRNSPGQFPPEAKAQLAYLVYAAEGGEVAHILRHCKPVTVLLSEQAHIALQGQQQSSNLWEAIA